MRNFILLAGATTLAACGGGSGAGPETVGSIAPPAGPVTSVTPTPTQTTASFVNPAEPKTYEGIGAVEHYGYKTRSDASGQYDQLYAGDANTVRDGGVSVTYNPRDAIFELTIAREKGIVTANNRFQDPAHRTDFGGAVQPQAGTPEIADRGIQYLQAGSGTGVSVGVPGGYRKGEAGYESSTTTFFYQKPGTTTKFVSYAGWLRNNLSVSKQSKTTVDPVTGGETQSDYLEYSYGLDRAAFAYGERSAASAVPRSGSGSYTGDVLATMVYNTAIDTDPRSPTYFQWLVGSQTTNVDFGTLGVSTALTGKLTAPTLDANTTGLHTLAEGTTLTANARSTLDLVTKGGFTGAFTDAKFKTPGGSELVVAIAGSSIDGAFFGPSAEEIGGGFRIVGGTPDERVDILGTFTGKK